MKREKWKGKDRKERKRKRKRKEKERKEKEKEKENPIQRAKEKERKEKAKVAENQNQKEKVQLNLHALETSLVGVYPFAQQNQVIIAYHVKAAGEIKLNHELDDYKIVAPADIKPWPMGTGLALTDWIKTQIGS